MVANVEVADHCGVLVVGAEDGEQVLAGGYVDEMRIGRGGGRVSVGGDDGFAERAGRRKTVQVAIDGAGNGEGGGGGESHAEV